QMDRLPSHTVIVCATNHPELLDRAVWRRFELKLEIGKPGPAQLRDWFKTFEASLSQPAGITPEEFAKYMDGESMAAVEAFTLDVRRKLVLSRGRLSPAEAVSAVMKKGNMLSEINREHKDGRLSNSPSKAGGRRKTAGGQDKA